MWASCPATRATPRSNVIKAGLRPRPDREGLPTFRRLTTMNLGPAYTDVAHAATETWPTLLLRWEAIARGLVQEQLATWLRVAAVDSMVARLGALGRRTLRSLPPEDAWTFALGPRGATGRVRPGRPTGQGGPG